MSFMPEAKMTFFALNTEPVSVVISDPFSVFFRLMARSFKNFTVAYFKTCALAFSAIAPVFLRLRNEIVRMWGLSVAGQIAVND